MPGITPISAGITSVKKWSLTKLPQNSFTVDYDITSKCFESFEWYVTALEDGDELALRCNYDIGLFNDSTVDGWLKEFCEILADISVNPSRSLYEVAKIDPEKASSAPEAPFLFAKDSVATPNTEYLDTPSHAHISNQTRPSSHSTAKELETQLINIWQDVLNTRDIGPDDNFFDLGGNSMVAAKLLLKLRKDLARDCPWRPSSQHRRLRN